MNPQETDALTRSVALIAMYLLIGYEDCDLPSSYELHSSGHLGVAKEIVSIACAISEKLETLQPAFCYVDAPGAIEYEVIAPLGRWLKGKAGMASSEAAVEEFERRYADWMVPPETQMPVVQAERG